MKVDTSSEAWRHECEARSILALSTLDERRAWLRDIERLRGIAAADQLRETMARLWRDQGRPP